MNVSLTPRLEAYIKEKVDSGLYSNASEVVREALRILLKKELSDQSKLERLRADLQVGLDDVRAGRVEEWNEEEALERVFAKYNTMYQDKAG